MRHGLIFDIEKFAIHDGPGIRTLIFFKGCPLNCLWCQNPESINPLPELAYRKSKCIKCNSCSESCPKGIIKGTPQKLSDSKCLVQNGCTICSERCPSNALEVAGKKTTVEELLKLSLEDKEYYEESKGGITCSGGEPTFQWSFVKEFLSACKNENISTAIETCGYFNSQIIDEIFELCDVVLFDLKHLNSKLHVKYTGKSNDLILKNLQLLKRKYDKNEAKQFVVRLPLNPLNDSIMHLNQIESYLLNLDINSLVLLPYHSLYTQKYEIFRLKRKKLKFKPYTKESLAKIKNYFQKIEITYGG